MLCYAMLCCPEAWYCSAMCCLKLGENAQGTSDLRRCIALDGTHYQAWVSLGMLFARARQHSIA